MSAEPRSKGRETTLYSKRVAEKGSSPKLATPDTTCSWKHSSRPWALAWAFGELDDGAPRVEQHLCWASNMEVNQ